MSGRFTIGCLIFFSPFVACGGEEQGSAQPPPDLGGLQSQCTPEQPCEAWLLCIDGVCRDHTWPEGPGELVPDVVEPPDVHGYLGDEGLAVQDVADAPDDVEPQDALVDGKPLPDLPQKDPDVSKPIPDAADSAPSPEVDAGDPLDAPGEEDVSDAQASEDVPEVTQDVGPEPEPSSVILYVSADSAATEPGGQFLALEPGQGWVANLTLPKTGTVIAMDVVANNVFSDGSCGRFRPAFWQLDEEGAWLEEPTWQSPELQAIQGKDGAQTFLLAEPPELPQGEIRAGLIYEQTCEGDPPIPWLFTDASGELDGTWLWSPQDGASPWVPGAFLGVEGRWALRLLIEVPVP